MSKDMGVFARAFYHFAITTVPVLNKVCMLHLVGVEMCSNLCEAPINVIDFALCCCLS